MNDEQQNQAPPLTPYYPGGIHVPPRDQTKPLMKMLGKMMPKPKGRMPHTPRGRKTGQTVKLAHKKKGVVWY